MLRCAGLSLLNVIVLAPTCIAVQSSIEALSPSFGYSIAAVESITVVGDPHAADGHGKLWIYTQLPRGSWELSSILEGEPGDSLGYSLAVDGHLLVAGAPGNRKAYLHDLRTIQPSLPLYFIAQDIDGYGRATAIHGIYVAVGSPASQFGRGQVDIYVRSFRNQWLRRQSLYGISPNEAFGYALAMDSEILMVGAPKAYEPRGERAGLVYTYQRTSGSNWVLQAELRGGSAGYGHRFGSSIALDHYKNRRRTIIGAPGASIAYIYTLEQDGWAGTYTFTPVPPIEMTRAGASVALFNEYAIIGAPSNSSAQNGFTWILRINEFGIGSDHISFQGGPGFGHAVASWENHYAISEPGTAIYIFSENEPLSAQKSTEEIRIEAYPNPFRDTITITFSKNAPERFFIIDASGRLVNTLLRNGRDQIKWDPYILSPGTYIILSGLTAKTITRLP